jgi:hypothetical protein
VGIDMGVVRFATLSTGKFIEPLNSFKKNEDRLYRPQIGRSGRRQPRLPPILNCCGRLIAPTAIADPAEFRKENPTVFLIEFKSLREAKAIVLPLLLEPRRSY